MKNIQFLTCTLLLASALLLPIRAAIAQSANTNNMVRLVYFLPNDRPVRPDRMEALGEYIKDTQQFYADEMERHGYGRKTFALETDKTGEPVVHHIDGEFPEEHYYKADTGAKVRIEISDDFDAADFQHIYFIAIDLSSERTHGGQGCGEASIASLTLDRRGIGGRHKDIMQGEEIFGGFVIIPASGDCLIGAEYRHRLGLPAHELGHAFGLDHDFREGRNSDYVLAGGGQIGYLSVLRSGCLSVASLIPIPYQRTRQRRYNFSLCGLIVKTQ